MADPVDDCRQGGSREARILVYVRRWLDASVGVDRAACPSGMPRKKLR
ncbi:hypothetical protein BH10CYA1_BH10CYA1_11410 [soil metagenome]